MAIAETYRQAALEHIDAADYLHQSAEKGTRKYVLSHYVAGLFVECMLRAYQMRISAEFGSRHDLRDLYKSSNFGGIIPKGRDEYYGERLSEVVNRWSNNHRYESEQGLLSFLKKSDRNWKIKGDLLKESSRRIVDAAHDIALPGKNKWTS